MSFDGYIADNNGNVDWLNGQGNDAAEVTGWPDNLKLKSSMTLFALAKPECEVFQKVPDKFFRGERDHTKLLAEIAPAEFNILHYGAIAELKVKK